jgi:hypothetical protein
MCFPLRISVMTPLYLHLEPDRLLCDRTFDPNSVFAFVAAEVSKTYSGSSSHIRGRCWEESPIRLSGSISCQSYLTFLRKAIYRI